MTHEGMVHALEEMRRLLKPDGILIDIHPIPEGAFIEVVQGDSRLFSERKRVSYSEDVIQAEKALEEVIARKLFAVERRAKFDFLTYAPSVRELRDYWEDYDMFDDEPKDEAILARQEELYAKADQILQASGSGAQVATHEQANITRLTPLT